MAHSCMTSEVRKFSLNPINGKLLIYSTHSRKDLHDNFMNTSDLHHSILFWYLLDSWKRIYQWSSQFLWSLDSIHFVFLDESLLFRHKQFMHHYLFSNRVQYGKRDKVSLQRYKHYFALIDNRILLISKPTSLQKYNITPQIDTTLLPYCHNIETWKTYRVWRNTQGRTRLKRVNARKPRAPPRIYQRTQRNPRCSYCPAQEHWKWCSVVLRRARTCGHLW